MEWIELAGATEPKFWMFGAIFLFACTAQATTGFGSIVIALTLSAHLYPIREALPTLLAVNTPMCVFIALRRWKHIHHPTVWRQVMPSMSIGLLAGILLSFWLTGPVMRWILGAFVVALAVREIYFLAKNRPKNKLSKSSKTLPAWLIGAGIMHGIYVAGGPILVFALSQQGFTKQAFRATLMMVWTVLDVTLLVVYVWHGNFGMVNFYQAVILLPTIPLGILIGDFLHNRVQERAFMLIIQLTLIFAGVALIVN